MSGNDIASQGARAVVPISKLFHWASSSKKGTIMLVDDAILREHSRNYDLRVCSKAFQNQVRNPNKDLMLILSCNLETNFDRRLNNGISGYIKFEQPGPVEREKHIRLHSENLPKGGGRKPMKTHENP